MPQVKLISEPTYELTLSHQEAYDLYRLIGNHVCGSGPTFRRLEGIFNVLDNSMGEFVCPKLPVIDGGNKTIQLED